MFGDNVITQKFVKIVPDNIVNGQYEKQKAEFIIPCGYDEQINLDDSYFVFVEKFVNLVNESIGKPDYTKIKGTGKSMKADSDYTDPDELIFRAFNHCALLIDEIEVRMNNKLVEAVNENYAQLDTFVKRKTSTLKNDTLYSVCGLQNDIPSRMNLNNLQTQSFLYKPSCVGMFKEVIKQNCEARITLKFTDDFYKCLQTIAIKDDDPDTVAGYISTAEVKTNVIFELLDVYLVVKVNQVDTTPENFVYNLDCYKCESRRIPDNTKDHYSRHSVHPLTNEIAWGIECSTDTPFFPKSELLVGDGMLSNDASTFVDFGQNIKKAYIKYQNKMYPKNFYENDRDRENGSKLQYQMNQFDQGFQNNAFGNESFDEYLQHGRYWLTKIRKPDNNRDQNLEIFFNYDDGTSGGIEISNIVVFNKFKKYVAVNYNEMQEVSDVIPIE